MGLPAHAILRLFGNISFRNECLPFYDLPVQPRIV